MARPWELPHPELPHHACSLGDGWWRGPAPNGPECEEALAQLGLFAGPRLDDGAVAYRRAADVGADPDLAAGPTEDPWCRAHWIAARVAAAAAAEAAAAPPPRLLAILNLTPDSFSDGGELDSVQAVVDRAGERLAEGAAALDLGAESTRPGAEPVPAEVQLERLLPAIEALLPLDAPLSIDTRSARVAAACLAAGASWINDVSALSDPAMAPTVAAAGADLCLMHSRGTPADMQRRTGYRHLLGEVIDELAGRCRLALAAGVAPARIQVDPGIGFAKDAEQSLALLGRCGALRGLGFPLLVGPSRKSCLVAALGERPPRQRDAGSAGVAALAAAQGAAWLRLHRGGELWDAVLAAAAAGAAARVLRPAEDAVPEVTG